MVVDDFIRVPCPAAMITTALARATTSPVHRRLNGMPGPSVSKDLSMVVDVEVEIIRRAFRQSGSSRTMVPRAREFCDKSATLFKAVIDQS